LASHSDFLSQYIHVLGKQPKLHSYFNTSQLSNTEVANVVPAGTRSPARTM